MAMPYVSGEGDEAVVTSWATAIAYAIAFHGHAVLGCVDMLGPIVILRGGRLSGGWIRCVSSVSKRCLCDDRGRVLTITHW